MNNKNAIFPALVICGLTMVCLWLVGCGQTISTPTTTTTTLPQVAAPSFSQSSGSYEVNSTYVTLECSTAGSSIYYTLDGTAPSASSTLYTEPISLESSKTVKAIAIKTGLSNSPIVNNWYDLYWWQAIGSGTNGDVNAIARDSSGNLYAGGSFSFAGGVGATRIAKWSALLQTWEALGSGFNNVVNSIICDNPNGLVYAGGYFTTADGNTANYIAKWNGSSWQALGGGIEQQQSGATFCLLMKNTKLYVGGFFSTIEGNTVNNIAKWDGTNWSGIGGVDSIVFSLAEDGANNLYLGGWFNNVGSLSSNRIVKWVEDESTWEAMSCNFYRITSLAYDTTNSKVYAGGVETYSGASHHVLEWNVNTWEAVGGAFNASLNALCVDSYGTLYAGGNFSSAEGNLSNYIAKWNGSAWQELGAGVNGIVNTIVSDNSGNVYIGGAFTQAGGMTANHIVKWGKKI
ncbi:MAG: chitobiase/beta-hexosaminidase C-terminal domain-containing protein [Candidatus Margulisiibacteriota bacterium]